MAALVAVRRRVPALAAGAWPAPSGGRGHEPRSCRPVTRRRLDLDGRSAVGDPAVGPGAQPLIGFTADRSQGHGGCNAFGTVRYADRQLDARARRDGDALEPIDRGRPSGCFAALDAGAARVIDADGTADLVIGESAARRSVAPAVRRSGTGAVGCASVSEAVGWSRVDGGATRRGVRKVRAPQRRVAGNARPP